MVFTSTFSLFPYIEKSNQVLTCSSFFKKKNRTNLISFLSSLQLNVEFKLKRESYSDIDGFRFVFRIESFKMNIMILLYSFGNACIN